MTDRRNFSTTYVNETIQGKPTRITHPDQSYRAYTYSSTFKPYFVSSVRDENGRYTYYYRDGNNRVYQINFPNGAYETFAYNGFGEVTTHRRTNGVYDAYDHSAYDATGRLIKRWDPTPSSAYPPSDALPHYTYTYYSSADVWEWEDRISRVTDPLGRITTYEYDRRSDGVQCAGRGLVTRIQYWSDTHDGTLPTGTYQLFGYDIYGNRTSVTDELGHTTRYEYDDYNRVIKVTNHMNQATTTSYALDWANPYLHTTQSIKYVVSPMNKNVVYDYDANLRRIDQVAALSTADEAWTLYEYDEVGNLIKATDPRFKATTYGYDNRNRQTSVKNVELNETTSFAYDGVGNKTRETRPDTAFRSWDYDGMNRLWHAYEWRYTDPPAANQTTTYGRDLAGNVRTITDAKGAVYSYDYDLKNLKISETYPVDYTGVSRTYAYHYDDAGNLDYLKNPANQYKHITFDSRNRPRHTWWDGNAGPDITTMYDAAGRMTSVVTNGGETRVAFGYDDANRKTSETETIKSYGLNQTHTLSYEYDDDGNRYRLVYPMGLDYRYTYTNRNQLANIQLAWAGTPTVAYTYDPAGNRSRRTTYYGAYTDYHYNPLNQVDVQTSYFANGTARFDYGFDAAHRIKYEQRDSGIADGFGYDPRNELTGFNQNGTLNGNGTVSAAYNVSITYDANGNRIEAYDGNHAPYATAPSNQYNSDWTGTLAYDGNENLTGRAGWTYTYDAQNRLVAIDGGNVHIHQHYDALNRIVARDTNGDITTNVWDNWNLIEERTSGDALRRLYFWGANPNEIVASWGPAYGDLFYFQDGRGNVTHLADPSNTVVERYTYFVSGQPNTTYSSRPNLDNRFLFEGALYIPQAEIYDMRNRFYHPNLGRFLQMDPIGFDAGDMNLFRYCGNDPVDRTDPMGLASVPSMRFYDQPLFPPERIAEWSKIQPPPLGSLIPRRTIFDLVKTGDRDIHVQRIMTEGRTGTLTKRIGWTDDKLFLHDPVHEGANNYRLTAEMKIDVYYADGAKQAAKDWAFPKEPQHAADFDRWAATTAARILKGLNSIAFKSPDEANRWFHGSGLQRTFAQTHDETWERYHKVGYDLKTCPHCYPYEAF